MTKEVIYVYLGTNGIIQSPVHLEDIYYIRKYRLWADKNKLLTKDNENFVKTIIVPENEVKDWVEVAELGQERL